MNQKEKKPPSPIKKILDRLLTGLVVLIALVVFYLAVIIGQPNEEALLAAAEPTSPQALLSARLPESIGQEGDISRLLDAFPAPIMRLPPIQGLSFVEGKSFDVAYRGAFARVAELHYQTQSGSVIILQSIYPRDAYSLLDTKSYSLTPMIGYTMLHLPAVRMDADNFIRFHLAGEEALYLLTLPISDEAIAVSLLNQTQLEIPLS